MSTITHVRFYPSDWLSGTRGLTAAETGIYITLIALMYERAGPITEDAARLARLCGASNSLFAKALGALLDGGKLTRVDGGLFNLRVAKEIGYVMEKSGVARDKAKSRWEKTPNKSTADPCNSTAEAMLTSSHKPVKDKSNDLSSAGKPAAKPKKPSDDEKVFEVLSDCLSEANARAVIEHRRAKGAKLTVRAAELLVKEFFKAHSPDDAAETMIAQGWQGFNVDWYRRAKPNARVIESYGNH